MASNPAMLDMMSSLMSTPGVLDSIIASNPQLQQVRGQRGRELSQRGRARAAAISSACFDALTGFRGSSARR